MKLVVQGGTVVNADGSTDADVVVEDGVVTGVVSAGAGAEGADRIIDAAGCLVVPGGVDPHVHTYSPTQKVPLADDVASTTRAAAFGGTTTIIDFAFSIGGLTPLQALGQAQLRAEGKAYVDYAFHVVLTSSDEATLSQLPELAAAGVTSYKLYMAYARRGLLMGDADVFRVVRAAQEIGALTMLHAENGPITQLLVDEALSRGDTGPAWHAKTRPELTEVEAIYRGLSIAQLAGGPVYFVHVSTAGGVEHLSRARRSGQLAYGETCPHYLLLDESVYEAPGFEAAKWVLTPPIRARANQDPLWRGLATGDLQAIATDHCPFCFVGGKDAGRDDFSQIPNGGPGVEHRLSLVYDAAVASGRLSRERWVALMATGPAHLFGLGHRKGRIAVNCDADLVVFDPAGETIVRADTSQSAVDYSMYEGRRLQGAVRTVISRGVVLVHDGESEMAEGCGRYVPRRRSGLLP